MKRGKLVGFKRFTSKKGKRYCVIHLVTPYGQRDLDDGCFGSQAEDIFLPDDLFDLLTVKDLNKDVEVIYEISSGRAFVTDLKVL